jgi:hypothetical protein
LDDWRIWSEEECSEISGISWPGHIENGWDKSRMFWGEMQVIWKFGNEVIWK